ncbi:MAG: NTP transferase domain-containing protein, partial [Selenomonadaceae bacterium]|nr:NTP transferase domain-containing protein [Selenomonadaceae bacterium]
REDRAIYPEDTEPKPRATLADTPVIIMAGGKGTRLYPYTKILPKPLIPIGNIPIVERIINSFREHGANRFYMILNYKKEMIKSYFSEFDLDYKMIYVDEPAPLGTAGGIRLIDEQFDAPVMVTNCDILIRADYTDILEHHKATGNALTIVSSLKHTVIPYGVIHSKAEGMVSSMEEKPHVSYLVNTGMYVIDAEYISTIPRDRVYNMTDFIEQLVSEDRKVGIYPVSEDSFLDMGEFEEMKRMEEKIYSNGLLVNN